MWSNAFCQTIDLGFPDPDGAMRRFAGARLTRIVAHASGRWLLELRSGERFAAELTHGWIAGGGRLVGLRWSARGRGPQSCCLYCAEPARDRWRRLLTRVRVPMATGLS
jgi:hypothetical protein